MDVSSVSTSSYAPPPQAQTQRSEKTEQAAPVKAKETESNQTEQKKPAPVVNTQGQTTGRIVNTSA
jgi:hypothetical protein